MEQNKDEIISALIESNDILQEEVTRLRVNSKVLRTVIRALRASLDSMRKQTATAQFNDELFRSFCDGEFDAPVVAGVKGGLPDTPGAVESAVANVEEASAPTASC